MNLWLPPLALLLDLRFADPEGLPHPVRGIGLLADRLEGPARRMNHPVVAGALAVLVLLLVTGGAVALLTRLPCGLGTVAAVYWAWAGLALGGLVQKCTASLTLIRRAQTEPAMLDAARRSVRMLVSRETEAMETEELYRSLAESVSENFNDAFVAPYFWLCLGGPVALWLYKTASTLDSMWGYTNERWLHIGRAAARLDDLLAFIPARLSALLLWLTAWPEGLPRSGREFRSRMRDGRLCAVPAWPGWAVVRRQARQSASPNAGWPVTAAAWLFGGRAGGPAVYHGIAVDKPLMGPETGAWTFDNTAALIRHVRRAGILGGLAMAAAAAFIRLF